MQSILSAPETEPRRDAALALILGAVAVVIAALGSWHVSLWTDEAVTVSAATRSLDDLWELTGHIDAVHAAYYTLMHFWITAFGASPFSLRFPSALAVGVCVAGTFKVGSMLADRRTGVLSALVLVFLPRASWMGIEGRSFAFGAAVAIWLTVVLVAALSSSRVRPPQVQGLLWVTYAVLAACGVALNLYVALVLCAHGCLLLLLRRTSWTRRLLWLASSVAGVVMASPIVLFSLAQSSQIAENELSPLGWLRNVLVNQWFLGSTPTGGYETVYPHIFWKTASIGLAGVCWALVLWSAVAVVRNARPRAQGTAVLLWAAPLVVIPTLAIFAYSTLGDPMYNPRYLTFAVPAVALLVGSALARIQRRPLRLGALALIMLLALPVYLSQRTSDAKSGTDWAAAASFVAASASPGDAVYFAPRGGSGFGTVEQTTRRIEAAYPAAFDELDDVTLLTTGEEDASIDGTSAQLERSLDGLAGEDRVWVIEHLSYPREASDNDEELLNAVGFDSFVEWQGTLTRITGFQR